MELSFEHTFNINQWIKNGKNVLIYGKEDKRLVPFYYADILIDSDYIRKVSNVFIGTKINEIFSPSDFKVDDDVEYLVVQLDTYGSNFEWNTIGTIQDFYHFMCMAEMYQFNITNILKNPKLMIWKISMIMDCDKFWKDNEVLLKSTDEKSYLKQNLGFVPNQNPGIYNHLSSSYTPLKKIKIKCLDKHLYDDLCSDEIFLNLYKLLERLKMSQFILELSYLILKTFEHCHKILNKDILDIVFKIEKNNNFINNFIYCGRILYLEEKSKYHTTRYDDRHLIDIDVLNMFPQNNDFYLYSGYLLANLGIKRSVKNYAKNLIMPHTFYGQRGFYSLKQAKEHIEIYTYNAFKDLDWNKTILNGSLIPACILKNPLIQYFPDFETYIEEYYPSNFTKNIMKINHGGKEEEKDHNIIQYESSSDEEDEEDEEDGKEEKEENNVNIPIRITSDIDLLIEADDEDEFDCICEKHFQIVKKNWNNVNLELKKIITQNKYKYKITGGYRDIDMFWERNNKAPGVVSKYHLDCVRAFYDGKTIKCLPSIIQPAMLGLNTDIRWVSCNKDIKDVIMKYYVRGFGTLICPDALKSLENYLDNHPNWPDVEKPNTNVSGWRLNQSLRLFESKIFYGKKLNVFNPSYFKCGIYNICNNSFKLGEIDIKYTDMRLIFYRSKPLMRIKRRSRRSGIQIGKERSDVCRNGEIIKFPDLSPF